MGFRVDLQTPLVEAYDDEFSDIVESFDFVVLSGENIYDSENDTYNQVETLSGSRGIFSLFDNKEIDGENIKQLDELVVVIGNEALIEPEINMTIRLSSGKEYTIVDPGKVTGGESAALVYNMQVRGASA